jgi:hypothetical protein
MSTEHSGIVSRADEPSPIAKALREMALIAWGATQEPGQPQDEATFEQAYLGQYSSFDAYTDLLVDEHDIDARLDDAIPDPFRAHVDIDIPSLSQALVSSGSYYALPAYPVGVWVFKEAPTFLQESAAAPEA